MPQENLMHVTPHIEGDMLRISYRVSGPWTEAFNLERPAGRLAPVSGGIYDFFCQYGTDISDVPASIAVIPFLCNVMPVAWLYDATVHVEEVDRDFAQSLGNVREGYAAVYPWLNFSGRLEGRQVRNDVGRPQSPPLIFFSGGVDAAFSMLGNRALSPTLLTIWGADIFFREAEPWQKVEAANRRTAQDFGVGFESIKSSFRLFLNTDVLDRAFSSTIYHWASWWPNFQFGIGLLGLAAPLAWVRKSRTIIISSSISKADSRRIYSASDPMTDMALRFAGCQCQHYDFTIDRQQKIAFICEQARLLDQPIALRVCWQSSGENCGLCEKCMRTFFAILAEGSDPGQFGFRMDDDILEKITGLIAAGTVKPNLFWDDLIQKLRTANRTEPYIRAILDRYPPGS